MVYTVVYPLVLALFVGAAVPVMTPLLSWALVWVGLGCMGWVGLGLCLAGRRRERGTATTATADNQQD